MGISDTKSAQPLGRTRDAIAETSHNTRDGTARRLTSKQRKAIVAATLGTIVEYADWIIYATFAPILAGKFFPASNAMAALLSVFAVFAVGFVMRPIGGAILGVYADRYGRKKGLTLSILLMSGASGVIGLCPTYESIGILAPTVLVFARLTQGFSAGGEYGSATAFLIESAPDDRRAFAGSWQWFAIIAGTLLSFVIAVCIASIGAADVLTSWGWRMGFIFAGILGLITLWIRRSVDETEIFKRRLHSKAAQSRPIHTVLLKYPRASLRVIGISMAGNITGYVWMVFYPSHAHVVTGMPLVDTLLAGIISVTVALILIPFVGTLADRIGRRPILIAFAFSAALYAWPSFELLHSGMSFWQLAAMQTVAMIILTGFAATAAATMAEQFPAEVRATGISLPYALSVTVFGGVSPYVMTAMTGWGYGHLVWIYVAAICVVGGIVYIRMPETKGKPLP